MAAAFATLLPGFVHRSDCAYAGEAGARSAAVERRDGQAAQRGEASPRKVPGADASRSLDFLFGALRAAPDRDSAKHVEDRIAALWARTDSDTTLLLMGRIKDSMGRHDMTTALKLLDAVVTINPDYIDGWNRRATLYYMQNDYARALADIQQVLAREPRHFGALTGLGLIMRELGEDKRALEAFRKAQELNPHIDRVPEMIRQLGDQVEGRDI